MPDFIALRGDPSDGLPGAKGIGEKTAAELLRRHGSLEGAIAGALRERSARVRGALRDDADELRAFKDIATLRRAKGVRRPRDRATDYAAGAKAARALGMRRLADRLEQLGELASRRHRARTRLLRRRASGKRAEEPGERLELLAGEAAREQLAGCPRGASPAAARSFA